MKNTTTPFPRRLLLTGTAALCALAIASPVTGFADPLTDKQAEADSVYASLNAMQDTLNQASDAYNEALMVQEEAQRKMDEAQAQIDEANARISKLQDHLGNSLRSTYRNGSGSFLDVLMGATSFEEFATSLDLLNTISEDKAQTVLEIKDQREALQKAKTEYAEQERVAAENAQIAYEAKSQAEATVAQLQSTYNSLSAEVAALVEQRRAAEEAASSANAMNVVNQSASSGSSGGGGGGNPGGYYAGGSSVVERAYACLGAPYVWAAVGPSSYDCSGLVSYCISGSHSRVFTSSSLMGYAAVSDPQPGDVCVKSGHCGIYIGGGQMIHAPQSGDVVKISSVQSGMKIVRP